MAGSINKVILVGNLGRDPEIRSTNDGTRIANLALATSETWRDRSTSSAMGTLTPLTPRNALSFSWTHRITHSVKTGCSSDNA